MALDTKTQICSLSSNSPSTFDAIKQLCFLLDCIPWTL